MTMKKSIVVMTFAAVLLFLGSLALIAYTLGWIAPLNTFTTNHVSVGELRYTLTGAFITPTDPITPNQELIDTAFSVDNDSPISSRMRIEITYTAYENIEGVITPSTETYAGGETEPLKAVFASGFVYIDGYWYMTDQNYSFAADSGTQALVSSVYYDPEYASYDFTGQDVTVTLTIQVSQSDNVSWTDLAGFDFSTGYPE
jgi:hypothetical protein